MNRMTIDTLHPDIKEDNDKLGREILEVIDPSPGVFGGEPIEGLVTLVYKCNCKFDEEFTALLPRFFADHKGPHHALYGPRDEKNVESGYTCYAD